MTDVLLFEDLDVSKEDNALTCLGEMLELLDCKLAQISTEGRISRADATALVERYAVQIDPRYPLNSFTQHPSATNVTVAQEGILNSAGQFLMELIKKAGEILMKIFRWILDLITFRTLREKRAAKKAEEVRHVREALNKFTVLNSMFSADQVRSLEEIHRRYADQYTGLIDDFVRGGTALKFLRAVRPYIFQIEASVRLRLEHLEHLLTILPTTEAEEFAFDQNAKTMLQSTQGREIVSLMQRFHVDLPHDGETPKRLMAAFMTHLTKLSLQPVEHVPDVEEVEVALTQNRHDIMDPILEIPDSLIGDLRETVRKLTLLKVSSPINTTTYGRTTVRALVDVAIEEALGVQMYMHAANLCCSARNDLIDTVWDYVTYLYQLTYSATMSGTDPAKRELAKRVTERLQEKMR